MTTKMYQTPIVEIAQYSPVHTLMVSEPKALEDKGTGSGYAPERRDVF
jgi:hypothetical protein